MCHVCVHVFVVESKTFTLQPVTLPFLKVSRMAVPLPNRLTLSVAVGPMRHVPIQKSKSDASGGSPGPVCCPAVPSGDVIKRSAIAQTRATFLVRIHTSVVTWNPNDPQATPPACKGP